MTTPIHELMVGWPASLQLALSRYMEGNRIDPRTCLRVDLVLALLRIDTPEALDRVRELTGKLIVKCPSAVPPWPPLPPAARPQVPTVTMVGKNDFPSSRPMAARFGQVKKGMTREQLLARGITARDINYWQKNDYLKFGKEA